MDLLLKLRLVAQAWVDRHQLTDDAISLKTLGVRSVSNARLFERDGMTVETFERVVSYLAEPRNWPAAEIPAACKAQLDAFAAGGALPDSIRVG